MAPGFLELFARLGAAMLCASIALIIWDVGTRSPGQVIADALAGARTLPNFVRGMLRFVIGLGLISVSVVLVLNALPDNEAPRYTIYQTGIFLAALAVELLIGEEVRRALGLRKGRGPG